MKTMKKISKYTLGAMLCATTMGAMTACDPLGVEPTSTVEESMFWANSNLARAYVDNFYFIGETATGGNNFQSEQWSDNCQGNLCDHWNDWRQFYFTQRQYDETSSAVSFSYSWTEPYKNIRKIYVALENIPSSGLDANLGNQLMAECHFFLAYVYFDMIKFLGTVPYVEKALNLNDETFLPRAKREYVFDQILANLDKSVEYFDLTTNAPELGRINKNVAYAFKSRVALYAACAAEGSAKNLFADDKDGLFKFEKAASTYYQQAYDAAKAVTGYNLESDYATLFTSPDAHNSVESIWPVMFKKGDREGFNPTVKNGPNHYYYNMAEGKTFTWECRGGNFPTQDLVDAYLMKDAQDGKWKNWWETSQMVALGVVKGADGEITGETADYRKMFENRDKRFYATIAYDGSYLSNEAKPDAKTLIQTWIDDTGYDPVSKLCLSLSNSALHTGMRDLDKISVAPTGKGSEQTITSYYLRKYSQYEYYDDGQLNRDQKQTCYFNLRYAEVLLNMAEAAIKLGGKDSEVKSAINKIRNRAGLDDYTGSDWMTELKAQRRLEFAFEAPGHRYWDLLRWGESQGKTTIDELNKGSRGLWISRKGKDSDVIGVNGTPAEPEEEGYIIPKFKTYKCSDLSDDYKRKFDHYRFYFMPFASTKMSGYDQLKQNPGWTNYRYNN